MKFWIGFFVISCFLFVMLPESRFMENISKLNNLNKDERNQDKLSILLDKTKTKDKKLIPFPNTSYSFSNDEDFINADLKFPEQFEYLQKEFTGLTYSYGVNLKPNIEIDKKNIDLFFSKFVELEKSYAIIDDEYIKNQDTKILSLYETIEEDAYYIVTSGRNYQKIMVWYNFLNNYCAGKIFEDEKFFNEIPYPEENKSEFKKIYIEKISPHFSSICKRDENFEKYKSIIQLIDPDFEYHKTLEKIDNIINFTYNKIYSDDGLLSKMKE